MKSIGQCYDTTTKSRISNPYYTLYNTKYLLFFVLLGFLGFSQDINPEQESVEKALYGFDINLTGLYFSAENKLANNFTIRSSVGFGGDLLSFNSSESGSSKYFYTAGILISLEPRWYYNLDKRKEKNKYIKGNSANFLSLQTLFPIKGTIGSTNGKTTLHNSIFINWGIRRQFKSSSFYYEFLAGYGVKLGEVENTHDYVPNLNLKLGYIFSTKKH